MRRRRVQFLLRAMGVVATAAGSDAVLRGAAGVPLAGSVAANVDTEFRFYGAWYAAMGPLLWRAAKSPERSSPVIRGACGALLVGAGGRVLSWRRLGPPSGLFQVLLVVEIVLSAVALRSHRRLMHQQQAMTAAP